MHGPDGHWIDIAAAAFGITAAVLLVIGSLILRQMKSRQQFLLMQQVLDKGLPGLPGLPPFWVLSLRQGVTTATLGVGLLVTGVVAVGMSSGVEMPKSVLPAGGAATTQATEGQGAASMPALGQTASGQTALPEGRGGWMQGPPDGPPPPPFGPGYGGGGFGPPGFGGPPRPGFDGPGPGRFPPTPDPALERWHRAQDQHALGLIAAAIGFILLLLGSVRIAFASVERKHLS
jgi:hypothetical protein